MRLYLALFAVAIGMSLGGLVVIGVTLAAVAWMLHVIPELLGSLARVQPVSDLDSSVPVHSKTL